MDRRIRIGLGIPSLRARNAPFFGAIRCIPFVLLAVSCLSPQVSAHTEPLVRAEVFFSVPSRTFANPEKKVFAHYFTPFPRSLDNLPASIDYYQTEYLDPDGESGKHRSYGGYLRNRPQGRDPIYADDWELRDMVGEVSCAHSYGIDGFTVDILSITGYHYRRMLRLIEAATLSGTDFSIVLMPDMTSLTSLEEVAFLIRDVSSRGSVFRLADNRIVLSPYYAEAFPAEEWRGLLARMRSEGYPVAFFPLFHNWKRYAPAFKDFSYGVTDWGARSAGHALAYRDDSAIAREEGFKWMQAVASQDFRPKESSYHEAQNTLTFRNSWNSAIHGGADWVHLLTWNDYSEGTEIAPSLESGTNWLELCAYYICWFKTGIQPSVARDTVFVSQRIQRTNGSYDPSRQTAGPFGLLGGTATDELEILACVKGERTLRIVLNGTAYERALLGAGIHELRFPLPGVSSRIELLAGDTEPVRGTSPWDIETDPEYQDLLYRLLKIP